MVKIGITLWFKSDYPHVSSWIIFRLALKKSNKLFYVANFSIHKCTMVILRRYQKEDRNHTQMC